MNLLQRDGDADAASMACTTTGAMASAGARHRLRPNTICSAPAAIVIRHNIGQPSSSISSATTTVRPRRAADLNRRATDAPATMPPTTAADHTGDYRGSGRRSRSQRKWQRTRKTTSDARTSCRRLASIDCDRDAGRLGAAVDCGAHVLTPRNGHSVRAGPETRHCARGGGRGIGDDRAEAGVARRCADHRDGVRPATDFQGEVVLGEKGGVDDLLQVWLRQAMRPFACSNWTIRWRSCWQCDSNSAVNSA